MKEFWQLIFSEIYEQSGESYYNGGITAFCFWDEQPNQEEPSNEEAGVDVFGFSDGIFDRELRADAPPRLGLELDGVTYHAIDNKEAPPGYTAEPIRLVDNGGDGKAFDTTIAAGSVGIRYAAAGRDKGLDTLAPVIMWRMFIDREVKYFEG